MRSHFHDKNVLVTGANGFIGSHLTRKLLNESAKVHILIRKNSDISRLKDVNEIFTVWDGDISNYESVRSCVRNSRPEIIFHLAAMRNVDRDISLIDTMIETNLKATLNLIRATVEEKSPLQCFINTGSSEEYGDGEAPFNENQREIPVSPYSASKVASTYFCQMLHRSFDIPVVTLRPFLTYGPGQNSDMFIPSLIQHCIRKKDFKMTAGDQTRDFVYVDDVVEAYLLAASTVEAIGEIINIGSGIEYSIKEVAEKVVNMMGNPIRLLAGSLPKRLGETNHFFCNNEKTRNILKWHPKIDINEGLKRTINWYKEFYQ